MKQYILLLIISLFSFTGAFAADEAGIASNEGMEILGEPENVTPVRLQVKGNDIHVQNAQGLVLEVYSITGAKIASIKISSNDESAGLNLTKGCYIVKVGNLVRRISVL